VISCRDNFKMTTQAAKATSLTEQSSPTNSAIKLCVYMTTHAWLDLSLIVCAPGCFRTLLLFNHLIPFSLNLTFFGFAPGCEITTDCCLDSTLFWSLSKWTCEVELDGCVSTSNEELLVWPRDNVLFLLGMTGLFSCRESVRRASNSLIFASLCWTDFSSSFT